MSTPTITIGQNYRLRGTELVVVARTTPDPGNLIAATGWDNEQLYLLSADKLELAPGFDADAHEFEVGKLYTCGSFAPVYEAMTMPDSRDMACFRNVETEKLVLFRAHTMKPHVEPVTFMPCMMAYRRSNNWERWSSMLPFSIMDDPGRILDDDDEVTAVLEIRSDGSTTLHTRESLGLDD